MGRMVTWAGLSQLLNQLGGPDQSQDTLSLRPEAQEGDFFVRTKVQTLVHTTVDRGGGGHESPA
jgi:hypothetical protein